MKNLELHDSEKETSSTYFRYMVIRFVFTKASVFSHVFRKLKFLNQKWLWRRLSEISQNILQNNDPLEPKRLQMLNTKIQQLYEHNIFNYTPKEIHAKSHLNHISLI